MWCSRTRSSAEIDIYEAYFGLEERPFNLTPNPRFLVLTNSHHEALSNLKYAIASRKGVMLLTGEAGSGKTTLVRTAIERQQSSVQCVHLHNPVLTRAEFVEALALKFGLSHRALGSKALFLDELERLLTKRHARNETTVLIVDEAQSLSLELLEELRLLANIETNEEKLLSVVIAGQPEVIVRLEQQELRQLKQRIALRCELQPLTLHETASYLTGRIRIAGGVGTEVFTREAVMLIHRESRGIPRTINVLADNVLLSGFATGQKPITRALVQEVCTDFRIGSRGGRRSGPIASDVGRPPASAPSAAPALPADQPAPARPADLALAAAPANGRLLAIELDESPTVRGNQEVSRFVDDDGRAFQGLGQARRHLSSLLRR